MREIKFRAWNKQSKKMVYYNGAIMAGCHFYIVSRTTQNLYIP